MPIISVILATYNWPEALAKCLASLQQQTDLDFEIVIADDGSSSPTQGLINQVERSFPVKITHLWQEDLGFRKTIILNQAIQAAGGDYLIFLDGDCIVQPDFIQQHRLLAEQNCLVTGSRILLDKKLSHEILTSNYWDFRQFKKNAPVERCRGGINKLMPLFIKLRNAGWRYYKNFVWRRIKGCNMACWKTDALAIQGFDETMIGWGHEDADFVFRLQKNGVIRKSGSWATEVLHLFHSIEDRSKAEENAQRVRKKILAKNQ